MRLSLASTSIVDFRSTPSNTISAFGVDSLRDLSKSYLAQLVTIKNDNDSLIHIFGCTFTLYREKSCKIIAFSVERKAAS